MRASIKSSLNSLFVIAGTVAIIATAAATPGQARGGGNFRGGGGFQGGGGSFRGGGGFHEGFRAFGGEFRAERRLHGFGYGGYDAYYCDPYRAYVNPWICGY